MTHEELKQEMARRQTKPTELLRLAEKVDTPEWNAAFFELMKGEKCRS